MLRRIAAVTMGVAVLSVSASGQGRGPEHERLSAMVGRWQTEVEVKATPAAASKVTGTEECAWFANLHVVCRADAKSDAGSHATIRLISYHPEQKQYAVYTIDSTGAAMLALGQVSGDTWTFSAEAGDTKTRLVMTMTPTGYTGIAEQSTRGGAWTAVSSINATRLEP